MSISPYSALGTSYGVPTYNNMQSQYGANMGSLGGQSVQSQYLSQLLNFNQGNVDPNFGLIPAASSNMLGATLVFGGAQSLPFAIGRGTSASNLPPMLTGIPFFDVKHMIDGQYQSPLLANPLLHNNQTSTFNPLVPYFSPQGQNNYFAQSYPSATAYPGAQIGSQPVPAYQQASNSFAQSYLGSSGMQPYPAQGNYYPASAYSNASSMYPMASSYAPQGGYNPYAATGY